MRVKQTRHLYYFRLIYCLLVLRFKQSLFKCVDKQPNLQNILALHALCLSTSTARIQVSMLATDSFFFQDRAPRKVTTSIRRTLSHITISLRVHITHMDV